MNLDEFLASKEGLASYQILNEKSVFYSTREEIQDRKINDTKFWGKLFDLSYQKVENLEDSIESTVVWKNSYDGSDIPAEEMNEWINDTVSRIKNLIGYNRDVLEIGCGNGLIFNSLIDNLSKYTGTDIAEKGLKIISSSSKGISHSNKISLYQLDALDIDKIPDHKYDLIIINSVAQYFPSVDYFLRVFKKLEQFASPKCHIFIGDIRSYELQKLFYFDVIRKKNPEFHSDMLKQKIEQMELRENETFYSMDFFKLVTSAFNYIKSCHFELKKGRFNNELNSYRYDVT